MSAGLRPLWDLLDGQVAAGRMPGYVAAVRHRGEAHVRAGGSAALGDAEPLQPGALFRIASLTKPVAAVLTLALVEDGVLALDDEVGRWLPELAAPRVLAEPAGALHATVAARRPVVVRDLLTMTFGLGHLEDPAPLRRAMEEAGLAPGPLPPAVGHDEFLARLGALPLAHQPGERWLYHTGYDVLAVLLARATGRPLGEVLAERVLHPLGMTSTGFWTREPQRLTTSYAPATEGGLEPFDAPGGVFAAPPAFESLSCGLLSTAADHLTFLTALLDGGRGVLSRESVALMTSDRLGPGQRASAAAMLEPGCSWGLGVEVAVEPGRPWSTPGRFGWCGGLGTTGYADPARQVAAVLFTQRMMGGPEGGFDAFWACLHSCLAEG
ncbi:CubicO group peptidase (beta-lactamase class C family) [Kineococcus xinjiangensis]|uniref:CubicO group peptidase (Beta-lactamase class C family) n=1 Tax=Kineococcus xinjiangensis TaxID=512762 RepID=A0A2S6IE17_9ACTN|nr:serine hydrolase domain-containing protein [Kineococcus xinjiangensis]PPK92462.1 CubicO group peptidase (beta-lactamase class C family) [Kineococcus xinjiangensis]